MLVEIVVPIMVVDFNKNREQEYGVDGTVGDSIWQSWHKERELPLSIFHLGKVKCMYVSHYKLWLGVNDPSFLILS